MSLVSSLVILSSTATREIDGLVNDDSLPRDEGSLSVL